MEDQERIIQEAVDAGVITARAGQEITKDAALSLDLREYFHAIADRLAKGEGPPSWEEVWAGADAICEKHGHPYGAPRPWVNDGKGREMILARGTPLHWQQRAYHATEEAQRAAEEGIPVKNSWHVYGDHTVLVIDTDEGPMWMKEYHAGTRMRKLLDSSAARSGTWQTADAELRALESLRKRVSESQFDSYVVNGLFPERSKRSDLFYFFRKGYPVIATSYHGWWDWKEGRTRPSDGGRVLAALCFHPFGYYAYTHAGVMTPTDEVIAQLLTMRADEASLWRDSGQWRAGDLRSGL